VEAEFYVIVRSSQSGAMHQQYKDLGVPVFFMPLGYFNPLNWIKYYRFFKLNQFDVVCDFNANFAGIPLLLARLAGIKSRFVFYRQGRDHFKQSFIKGAYNKLLNKLVYKYSTKILANSYASLAFFFPYRQSTDNRFKVIYNGVDKNWLSIVVNKEKLRAELGIPNDAFIIGHSGRLDKAKNHSTILAVAAEIIVSNKNIYFLICGKGTEELKDQVKKMKLQDNVLLLGYRKDVNHLLKIMDAFYFPSLTEGQPNALIEAILAGLPFVASNIAAVSEIIPDDLKLNLVHPMDIKSARDKLNNIIDLKNESGTITTYPWAHQLFDGNKRFEDFLAILLN
jgi:glycosyltransferase involved in cell wall biosynthesis